MNPAMNPLIIPKIITSVEYVTPEKAREYLAKRAPNRKVRRSHVEKFKRIIGRLTWRITHQGIAFSPEGLLLDGQHRLIAISEGTVGVWIVVSRNVDEQVIRTIDTDGLVRTATDGRTIAGYSPNRRGCRYMSILRNLLLLDYICKNNPSISDCDMAEQIHERDIDAILANEGIIGRFTGPVLATIVWMRPINAKAVDDFAHQLVTGSAGATASSFLRWWSSAAAIRSGGDNGRIRLIKVTACALHAQIEGRELSLVKASDRALEWAHSRLGDCRGRASMTGE
jgi:hypothetical protein